MEHMLGFPKTLPFRLASPWPTWWASGVAKSLGALSRKPPESYLQYFRTPPSSYPRVFLMDDNLRGTPHFWETFFGGNIVKLPRFGSPSRPWSVAGKCPKGMQHDCVWCQLLSQCKHVCSSFREAAVHYTTYQFNNLSGVIVKRPGLKENYHF